MHKCFPSADHHIQIQNVCLLYFCRFANFCKVFKYYASGYVFDCCKVLDENVESMAQLSAFHSDSSRFRFPINSCVKSMHENSVHCLTTRRLWPKGAEEIGGMENSKVGFPCTAEQSAFSGMHSFAFSACCAAPIHCKGVALLAKIHTHRKVYLAQCNDMYSSQSRQAFLLSRTNWIQI